MRLTWKRMLRTTTVPVSRIRVSRYPVFFDGRIARHLWMQPQMAVSAPVGHFTDSQKHARFGEVTLEAAVRCPVSERPFPFG